MNIEKMIREEYLSLTDKIYYFGTEGTESRDYQVMWKMEGKKTIFNKGVIIIADNDYAERSFVSALEKKYETNIVMTNRIKKQVEKKVYKARELFYDI